MEKLKYTNIVYKQFNALYTQLMENLAKVKNPMGLLAHKDNFFEMLNLLKESLTKFNNGFAYLNNKVDELEKRIETLTKKD